MPETAVGQPKRDLQGSVCEKTLTGESLESFRQIVLSWHSDLEKSFYTRELFTRGMPRTWIALRYMVPKIAMMDCLILTRLDFSLGTRQLNSEGSQ